METIIFPREECELIPVYIARKPHDDRWNPNGAVVLDREWGRDVKYTRCNLLVPKSYAPSIEIRQGRKFLKLTAAGYGLDGIDNYLPTCVYNNTIYAYFERESGTEKILFAIR